ncbi:SMC-Scp complex subunit ScpB [Puniceicoccaceae bacterium K14]|nr:SMC-Scp complex subunit ScpB [Puniceicoccaceae bacterium K14]
MAFSLERVLKALLFGASGPLTLKDIQRVFTKYHEQQALPEEEEAVEEEEEEPGVEQPFLEADGMPTSDVPSLVTSTQIREAMDRIASGLEENDEVYRLQEKHSGYQLVSATSVGEWVRLLRDEPRPVKLSQSALETLAVIAYRQPAVRAEIEKIRGVSVDNAIGRLLEREFIQVIGRADLPGRPIQYGTTEQFLEFVGVRSIEELPSSDVLSPRQIDAWIYEASNQKKPDETDMGLPEGEREEGEEADNSGDEGVETIATEEENIESIEETNSEIENSELDAEDETREEIV